MKKMICIALTMQFLVLSSFAQPGVQHLLTENRTNPVGLDMATPRFSWQLVNDKRNLVQTAYEIQVFAPGKNKTPAWRSGKITSAQSVFIPYAGTALQSGKKYKWLVQVWDNNGRILNSDTASFQMAL
jgi:alpha-L-rhamnosidase